MNTFRYYLALILVVSLPPALLLWFTIHPFARHWRKIGPAGTYAVLSVPVLLLAAAVFRVRSELLAVDLGTRYWPIGASALCLGGAAVIAWKRKKQLTFRILAGIPELSPRHYPGKLLTEGIYSRIRHPRYAEAFLGVLGYALLSNYLAGYVLAAACIPVGYWLVVLEERELHRRFGRDYAEYSSRVPRFIPKASPKG
ncbi:MAG: isoprenylcysteine carboxylmethyltransferase family protein [Acidobacteriota bacterium]